MRHAWLYNLRTASLSVLAVLAVAGCTRASDKAEAGEKRTPQSERVVFPTSDGVRIVGDYYPAANAKKAAAPVAILLHMYTADRATWKPLIPALHAAGFAALAIDMRGHGESGGKQKDALRQRVMSRDPAVFAVMYLDVEGAYTWLAKEKAAEVDLSRFVLVGASVGCSVALDYASRDSSVDAIVCMTPGEAYMGLRSAQHVKRLQHQPTLLLASEDEKAASLALAKLNDCVEAEAVGPGRVHGTRMFGKIKDIEKRVTSFLKKHVGAAGSRQDMVYSLMGIDRFVTSIKALESNRDFSAAKVRRYGSAAEALQRGLQPASRPEEEKPQSALPVDSQAG